MPQWQVELVLHLRLLRLLRLVDVTDFMHKLEARFDLNLTYLNTLNMIFRLLYLAHLLGCFFFAVATVSTTHLGYETSWLTEYRGGEALEESLHGKYQLSVYWAIALLTTVGTEEIIPQNRLEIWCVEPKITHLLV